MVNFLPEKVRVVVAEFRQVGCPAVRDKHRFQADLLKAVFKHHFEGDVVFQFARLFAAVPVVRLFGKCVDNAPQILNDELREGVDGVVVFHLVFAACKNIIGIETGIVNTQVEYLQCQHRQHEFSQIWRKRTH